MSLDTAPRIEGWIRGPGEQSRKVSSLEELEGLPPEAAAWVDVRHPTPSLADELKERFSFHEAALLDVLGKRSRSRLFKHGDYLYLTFTFVARAGHHDSAFFYLGRNVLITIHEGDIPELKELQATLPEEKTLAKGPDFILYRLLDAMVRAGLRVLDHLEFRQDAIDSDLFLKRRRTARTTLKRLFRLRQQVMDARRSLAPGRDALALLSRGGLESVAHENQPYFLGLYDEALRLLDGLDNLRDALSGTLSTELAQESNRLNDTVRVLTVISTIFMPLTLISGIYGMNFKVPEYRWSFGYFYALGLMALVAVLSLLYSRHRGWLTGPEELEDTDRPAESRQTDAD